jgi:amino acid transporter
VRNRRVNPGRAAVLAVALLAILYAFASIGLQGAVSPAKLQANSSDVLVYVGGALGGSGWAKVMALALALSVIATTGTGIVLTARMMYGMAIYRALPRVLSNINRRFSTPVWASVVVGVLIIALTWVYLLATTVQGAFDDVVDETGLLFAVFYVFTALATMTYYRRRLTRSVWDALVLGILPFGAAAFLVWMFVKSVMAESWPLNWSLIGIGGVGILLMLGARFIGRSSFFQIRRESEPRAAQQA